MRLTRRLRLHAETPLRRSAPLSRALGADVFLKYDCWQPPGSFKIRGIGLTCKEAVQAGATRLVSSSGGNAGVATAYAGHELGVPVTVVLPTTTPAMAQDLLAQFGATVEVHGAVWDEANERAKEIVESDGGFLVHPFDQPSTWKGHSSVVHECARQLGRPADAIVTVCGGGGLLMGICQGVKEVGWDGCKVVVCETFGAASMSKALQRGELVTLPAIESCAKSLGALTVGKQIFEHCLPLYQRDELRVFNADDQAAVRACARFLDDHRVLVEPACGMALAAAYDQAEALRGCKTVIVEVCGGAMVTRDILAGWMRDNGL